MFETSTALPLFPTLVWMHDLRADDYKPMNERLLARIDAIISPRPALRPGQTWQTDNDLHQRAEFAELLPYINTATAGALEFLQIEYEAFEITGCWANVNPQGAPHATHAHPNNYLSGVYYVRSTHSADSISFYDPRPQPQVLAPRVRQKNNHNAMRVEVPVKDGRLLVFPSWFRHSVLPNAGRGDRVSISFNIMFPAFSERMSPPKWHGITGRRDSDSVDG